MVFILSLFFAALLTTVLIPVCMRAGFKAGMVDIPNARKVHSEAIPRTGGIALVIGTLIPFVATTHMDSTAFGIGLGAVLILILGIFDDLLDLDYRLKLFGQIAVVVLTLSVSGLRFSIVSELWPESGFDASFPTFLLSVVFLLATINAINLADGLDGLAAGICLLIFTSTGFLAYIQNGQGALGLCICMIGASIGFLRFNTHPAIVFMGDTGSQFLGFMVGIAMMLLGHARGGNSSVLALYLIGIPVLDTLLVIIERIIGRRSIFKPDMNHLHHKLLKMGLKHSHAVVLIYATQLGIILVGWRFRSFTSGSLLAAYVCLMSVCIAILLMVKVRPIGSFVGGAITQELVNNRPALRRLRIMVSQVSWFSLIGALSIFYLFSPIWGRPIAKDVGAYSLIFSALVLGFKITRKNVPGVIFRLSAYFVALYYVVLFDLGKNQIAWNPTWVNTCLFFLIGISYFCHLISTNDEIPIVTMDYLLLAVVVFTFFLPPALLQTYHVHTITAKILVTFLGFELVYYKLRTKNYILAAGLLPALGLNFVMAFWPWVL
jgi:UDP-GlcNAc:undecaprenyl-phosphate GlcNAc-1-phosphate transferase